MKAIRRGAGNSGFTLIELLVVIAIIALLASILMPTLQKAQQMAQRAQCASMLKHHYDGYQMYAQDWDDYVLSTIMRLDGSGYEYPPADRVQLIQYISKTNPPPGVGPARENPIFLCPTAVKLHDTTNELLYGQKAWQSQWTSRIFSTMGAENDDLARPSMVSPKGDKIFSRRFIDYKELGSSVCEADDKNGSSYWSLNPLGDWLAPTDPWCQQVKYRHVANTLNLLLGDGHVIQLSDTEGTASVTNNRFFVHEMPS